MSIKGSRTKQNRAFFKCFLFICSDFGSAARMQDFRAAKSEKNDYEPLRFDRHFDSIIEWKCDGKGFPGSLKRKWPENLLEDVS